MPLVRVTKMLPRILAPGEVDALLAALRCDRDRAMVEAMVLGGLRRCEVLGLDLADVRVGERRVFVADGKGGRQRLIPCQAGSSPPWAAIWIRSARRDSRLPGCSWRSKNRAGDSRYLRTAWTRLSAQPVAVLGWAMPRAMSCVTPA